MGNIVARVDKEGIVRYTNNPNTAQFAGMFIERCVSDRGVVAYYFLERKTRKNTGWSLSQQEYDQAMRVGAFIPVAQRKAVAKTVSANVPEPTYYQKSHDYATGRTVGQSRTGQTRQTTRPQTSGQTPQKDSSKQRVVMSRANTPGAQMPDNTAGFSMSVVASSSFFKESTPTFDVDVLQESEPEKKKGFFGRLFDGIKSFFVRPVVTPPTTMALPAPGETSSPNAPVLSPIATASQLTGPKTSSLGRHYKGQQDADVPVIPRGRG